MQLVEVKQSLKVIISSLVGASVGTVVLYCGVQIAIAITSLFSKQDLAPLLFFAGTCVMAVRWSARVTDSLLRFLI